MTAFGPQPLEALYEQHGSVAAVARHLGRSEPTVRGWFRKRGIKVARTGFPGGRLDGSPLDFSTDEWRALYAEHGSVLALSRHLGRGDNTIRYHLRKHGIEIKRTGYRSPKAAYDRMRTFTTSTK